MRKLQLTCAQRLSLTMLRSKHLRRMYVTPLLIPRASSLLRSSKLRRTWSNIAIGQSTLPTTCSVSQHTPIAADDCKPNKSLRLTVRAFLKSEERKREKEKAPAVQTPTLDNAPSSAITAVEQPPTVAEPTKIHRESHVETNGAERSEK